MKPMFTLNVLHELCIYNYVSFCLNPASHRPIIQLDYIVFSFFTIKMTMDAINFVSYLVLDRERLVYILLRILINSSICFL